MFTLPHVRTVVPTVGVLAMVAFAGSAFWLLKTPTPAWIKNNPVTLTGSMLQQTSQMLAGTKKLASQVEHVNQQMGQVNQEAGVVQRQLHYGQVLQQGLALQQQLTARSVYLMQQILNQQQETVRLTRNVVTQTGQLAPGLTANAATLQNMGQLLEHTQLSSNQLNSQLDLLLVALNESLQDFRAFGQAQHLLATAVSRHASQELWNTGTQAVPRVTQIIHPISGGIGLIRSNATNSSTSNGGESRTGDSGPFSALNEIFGLFP